MTEPNASVTVEIASLNQLPEYQIRDKLNWQKVRDYANAIRNGTDLGPVSVALVNGAAILVDGFHRVAALKQINVTTVEANVTEATADEALWMSAQANIKHGLQLTAGEMRKVFQVYVTTGKHRKGKRGYARLKSYGEIVTDLGGTKNRTTIHRWMRDDFPEIASKMGKDGISSATGGYRENKRASLHDKALEAIRQALAASQGVNDPAARGEIIEAAEEALRAMKDAAPWRPLDRKDLNEF